MKGVEPSFKLRLFNRASRLMERLGRRKPGFLESADALHAEAARAVGHDDFGERHYLEGYRVLLGALDREARLSPFGAAMLRNQIVGILKNRLIAQGHWASRPSILATPVEKPLFILGMPRAGTTAMHHLLGADPRNQPLEYWLAAAPQPRPPRDTWRSHPDFKRAEAELKAMYELDPSLKAVHLMRADGPEECRHLLQQSFADDTFDCNATIPSYSEWYAHCDMRLTYEHHRKLLQLIASSASGEPDPRPWLLKYPVHTGNLRTLMRVYPDARFIQTHRDPARVIPSICSLVAGWRALYEEDFDAVALGRWQLALWARRLNSGVEVRKDYGDDRFFDVHFRDVQSDPVGAVRRMYEHFGIAPSEEAERRMRAWRDDNPPGKHGEHHYDAADYGLDDASMREAFAPYLEHFQVETE